MLYTIDDFIGGNCCTKRGELNEKIVLYAFIIFLFFLSLRVDGSHTSY